MICGLASEVLPFWKKFLVLLPLFALFKSCMNPKEGCLFRPLSRACRDFSKSMEDMRASLPLLSAFVKQFFCFPAFVVWGKTLASFDAESDKSSSTRCAGVGLLINPLTIFN